MSKNMFSVAIGEAHCACGKTWPRDPVLEVPCPVCGAPVGKPCQRKRPSGHTAWGNWAHNERDLAALRDTPDYEHDCPCRDRPAQQPPGTPGQMALPL